MSARWVTFLVWALVAASAAAWGLKLFVTAPTAPPQVTVAGQSQMPRGDITRVLGADAPPVDPSAGESLAGAPDARFQLIGVVAPRGSETARGGVALIAVDGKPPKDALAALRGLKDEEVKLGRREIYVHYGDGMGKSKLVIPAAKAGTARNINTIATLARMAAEL